MKHTKIFQNVGYERVKKQIYHVNLLKIFQNAFCAACFGNYFSENSWWIPHGQVRHYAARKTLRQPAPPLTSVRLNDHVKDRVHSHSLGPFTRTFLDRASGHFFTVSSNNSSSGYRTPMKFMFWFYIRIVRVSMGRFNIFLRHLIYILRFFFSSTISTPPPPHTHTNKTKK